MHRGGKLKCILYCTDYCLAQMSGTKKDVFVAKTAVERRLYTENQELRMRIRMERVSHANEVARVKVERERDVLKGDSAK